MISSSLPFTQFAIFLYTSLYDGVPKVLLEAMSYGLAVIAPDVGGVSEVVIDGETGILLPSLADDGKMAASYVEALLRLINNPDLSAKLGQQSRALVRKNHSPEVYTKRVAELFDLSKGIITMHKMVDVPRTPSENPEVAYYKALAHRSEERARDIRRIATLERVRLEERLLEQEPTIKAYVAELERLRLNTSALGRAKNISSKAAITSKKTPSASEASLRRSRRSSRRSSRPRTQSQGHARIGWLPLTFGTQAAPPCLPGPLALQLHPLLCV